MRKITFASGFPDYIPKIELEEIDNSVKSTRRIELEIAEKIFEEWRKTKFWDSIFEIQYKTYLQSERAKTLW